MATGPAPPFPPADVLAALRCGRSLGVPQGVSPVAVWND